jgi:hypothetical protein
MKNVGQYPECCIPIDMKIGQPYVIGTLLEESTWPNNPYAVPADGWTDEHKSIAYYYGWTNYYSSNSGGSPREARIIYYRCRANYVFYSYAIDASDYGILKLRFKSYINHYYGSTYYQLEAGYSFDADTWYPAWHEEPSSSGQYDVEVAIEGGSETLYIGFWVLGNPYYMNYWYLDDVEVVAMGVHEEYADNMCQGPDIDPNQEVTFTFDPWTPAHLATEETATIDYIVEAAIEMEGDRNPGNDLLTQELTVDYWHDVGVKSVDNPDSGAIQEAEEYLYFDDGTTVNALGLTAGGTFHYGIKLTPEELGPWACYSVISVYRKHTYTSPFSMDGVMRIYGEGSTSSPGDILSEEPFSIDGNDWHEVLLSAPVKFDGSEDVWVTVECTHSAGQYPAAMDPALNYPNKGNWISLDGSSWTPVSTYGFYCDWNLRAGIGKGVGIDVFMQPGNSRIEATVENIGTFPELDLTCYADIYSYINLEDGELVYEDLIADIDLDDPLGGTESLRFTDFTFADEGVYGLFVNIPDDNDDKTGNNELVWGIGVDDTIPTSEHWLDPPLPTGLNDWYVDDIEVTLNSTDPESNNVSSGVQEIRYTINGGEEQSIAGSIGTFVLHEDGEDIHVEYWSVDRVGNEGVVNDFYVSIDQTVPFVNMSYEVGGNQLQGWNFTFTSIARDVMSGMDRVEFHLNDVLQHTDVYDGDDEYSWSFLYWGNLKITIKAIAYDNAGLTNFTTIVNPKNANSHSTPQQQQQNSNELPKARPLPR